MASIFYWNYLNYYLIKIKYKEIEEDFLMNKQFNFSSMSYLYGAFNNEIKILLKQYIIINKRSKII